MLKGLICKYKTFIEGKVIGNTSVDFSNFMVVEAPLPQALLDSMFQAELPP